MRQAVIIIHGMGEQIPMGTLKGFVDAVWTTDQEHLDLAKPDPNTGEPRVDGVSENAAWFKPDEASNSFELRRITTEKSARKPDGGGRKTDFFEYYWAHHIDGMTFKDVVSWMKYLLFRNPLKSVPKDVLFTWSLLWVITILSGIGVIWSALPKIYNGTSVFPEGVMPALIGSLASVIGGFVMVALGGYISKLIASHFGDVVGYVRPDPPNIASRQIIRENGVELLEKVLNSKKNGKRKFDRVVIVAHSLGTIIGYDVLTHAFARMNTKYDLSVVPKPESKRARLEEMVRMGSYTVDEYQSLQREAINELMAQGNPWAVTDFITLGSPLTHAEFLLEKNMDAVRVAQRTRTFPTCPPILEYDGRSKKQRFTYAGSPKDETSLFNRYLGSLTGKTTEEKNHLSKSDEAPRFPHHAALFAYTRWSNLYSPSKFTLWGDQVSGPLAKIFGGGIKDIQVMPGLDKNGNSMKGDKSELFAHVKYWSFGRKTRSNPPYVIKKLRAVLNLSKG